MRARLDVTVRSSGWGPRRAIHYRPMDFIVPALVGVLAVGMSELWPRDGVAIIIRRESK